MLEPSLSNLISWTEQVFVIAMLGWLLPILFRIRHPRTQLAYCHAVLALCLILPLVEPWRHPVIHRAATTATLPPSAIHPLPWARIILWTLAAGALVRLLWLLIGLWQIRSYRIGAMPLYPIPESVRAASSVTHTDAVLCISPHVTGPVMLGWLTPVILLPESFLLLEEEAQCGIVCHELLHVRRHDWLVTLFEELAGGLFWFNPAIWAMLAQTRLAREELVDSEVVRLTASRDPYIDALLAIARGQSVSDLAPAPAPLFLRRRHLTQRMHSLLKEISMSKFRLLSSYGSIAAVLAFATWIIVGSFPLVGQPQVIIDSEPTAVMQPLHGPQAVPAAIPQPMRLAGRSTPVETLRADARQSAGIALQPRVAPEPTLHAVSVPPDPNELAFGSVQSAISPADRLAATDLLNRATETSNLHLTTTPPFELKASFIATGNAAQTGSGEMTETWYSPRAFRWTAAIGGISVGRISLNGRTAQTQPSPTTPMRIQMLRNAIYWTERPPTASAMFRTAHAQWNGKPVTCLLTSAAQQPVTNTARIWAEEERCIDDKSGLIQIFSVAPGTAMIYGYNRNQQFHGRSIPDQITIYMNGSVVLDAQVTMTDAAGGDSLQITPEMMAMGRAIFLRSTERIQMNIGDVSDAVRPVIVHAIIDGFGKVIDAELSKASDPTLAEQALELVRNNVFATARVMQTDAMPANTVQTTALQRDAYINVRFGK